MPNLLNRFKHEEFESNSTLQIKIRRKERAEKEGSKAEKEEVENFAPQCEISHHGAKFLTMVRKFLPAPLVMLPLTF